MLNNYQSHSRSSRDSRGRRDRSDSVSTISSNAPSRHNADPWCEPAEVGPNPFGKELSRFNVIRDTKGRRQLRMIQKFQNAHLDKAMGVEVSLC